MINVKQLFFCDEVQQAQFGKMNFIGMLPSRKISIYEVPYIFSSNLVVDCFVDPGEYHNDFSIRITDLDSGRYEDCPFFVLEDVFDKTVRIIRWFHIKMHVVKYVPVKISVILDNDKELYSETFEFCCGPSPNLMLDLTTCPIDSSGILGPNVTINVPETLVKLAHKELIIIDQYLTADYFASLLNDIHPQTKISILAGTKSRQSFHNFSTSDYSNEIEIRFSPHVKERFHDRFVILNGTEIYHLGYSLKDLDKQISRYSKVTHVSEIDEIFSSFNMIWPTATPL